MAKTIVALIAAVLLLAPQVRAGEGQDFDTRLVETELPPGKALILVRVEDNHEKPLPGVIVTVQQGARPPFSRLSDKDGIVELIVPADSIFRLRFLSLDVSQNAHVEEFDIPDEAERRYSLVMTYTPPKSKVFVLEGVFFDTGKATLQPRSRPALDTLVEYLKMKETVEIELAGHTDNVGEDDANQKLSEARAEAVRQYAIGKGIAAARIRAVGYGESSPVESNDAAEGREKNRRTEVRVLKE